MPRYYFDIHNGFDFKDDDGREVANIEDLRLEAMKIASEISVSESREKDGYTIVVEVRDEHGANTLTVRMVCQIDDYPRQRLSSVS